MDKQVNDAIGDAQALLANLDSNKTSDRFEQLNAKMTKKLSTIFDDSSEIQKQKEDL